MTFFVYQVILKIIKKRIINVTSHSECNAMINSIQSFLFNYSSFFWFLLGALTSGFISWLIYLKSKNDNDKTTKKIIEVIELNAAASPTNQEEKLLTNINLPEQHIQMFFEDVNHDGLKEMIIVTPVGVHGSQLFAYKIDALNTDQPLSLIDTLSSDCPYAFSIDYTKTVKGPLVICYDTATDENNNYIGQYTDGYRDQLWYYIDDEKFVLYSKEYHLGKNKTIRELKGKIINISHKIKNFMR